MRLYVVAGEASGDARGAELMRSVLELDPGVMFHGRGGPQMAAMAQPGFHNWTDKAGVIGFIDVLKSYPYFKQEFQLTLAEIEEIKPDALLLIDYPGFNLRLAAALRKRGIPTKVIYYISPQVWAWHRSRIAQMAKTIDLMLCIFPFEKPLYEQSGLKTEFVGHPMLDSLGAKLTGVPRDPELVGLFPGSRRREVRKIFPLMLEAAKVLKLKRPELKFEAAAASKTMRALMSEYAGNYPELNCSLGLQNSHELMQRAAAGMVASGTATMEAAFFRLPFALVYKVAWLTYAVGRRLIKVRWLGMPNLLVEREVVREFIQEQAQPQPMAQEMLRLLGQEGRTRFVEDMDKVIASLGQPGAAKHAAKALLAELQATKSSAAVITKPPERSNP